MAAPPPPPPPSVQSGRYAGFWIRFLAYIIDSVIVDGIAFGLIKATGVVTVQCPEGITDPSSPLCGNQQVSPLLYVFIAIPVLYFIITWATGGTFGQRMLGMRVVNAATGGDLGFGRSFLRYIGYLISAAVILIGLIWAAFDSRKQGWHDKIAGSLVIRRT